MNPKSTRDGLTSLAPVDHGLEHIWTPALFTSGLGVVLGWFSFKKKGRPRRTSNSYLIVTNKPNTKGCIMKTKYLLLSAVLTIALTLPMFGQHNLADTAKTDMKQPDLTSMMGKPTADASVGGLHMKVWLVPQDSMGMKATGMRMDNDTVEAIQGSRTMNKAMTDSMTAGTHRIVLDVTEIATGKEIADASAKVLIESPSKKSSSVNLTPMMQHFGGALTLNEKGEYRFTVNVNVGGISKTTQFLYAVK